MKDHAVILFDGVCNLCNASVQFVIRHDATDYFRFASLQGDTGQKLIQLYGLNAGDMNSFVLIENNQAFIRSTAALKVAGKLKMPVKLLYGFIIVPAFIRDGVYRFISKNRYSWFGKKESCMIPTASVKEKFLD